MTGSATTLPLVTVGIPLYRSRPFLDTIRGNIRALDYPNLEVIISDRHGLDDALQVLATEFAADGRVTCLQGTDALTWVEHFNLLLHRARGKYAVLMAHDDSYPASYLRALVGALDATPDAVLAFGRVDQESLDGFLPTLPFSPPPVSPGRRWSLADALRLLTTWQLWIAFRGAVRCEVIRDRDLYIRPTYRTVRADIYWLFGLALIGRLLYVPSTSCTKRFYRSSTGAAWRFDWPQGWDACRVLGSYIRDFAPTPIHGLAARCVVVPWCLVQPILPRGAARRMMRAWQVHVRGGYES